jgi:hypothetical protein
MRALPGQSPWSIDQKDGGFLAGADVKDNKRGRIPRVHSTIFVYQASEAHMADTPMHHSA